MSTVIALHGYGGDAATLSSELEEMLGRDVVGTTSLVVPEGPCRVEGGWAWFDPDTGEGFDRSMDLVGGVVQELGGHSPLVLIGRSQGAAVALSVAGRMTPPAVDLLVLWSGFAHETPGLPLTLDGLDGVEVLSIHGVDDDVVPVWMADDVSALAAEHGATVTVERLPCGHEPSSAAANLVVEHVRRVMGRPPG